MKPVIIRLKAYQRTAHINEASLIEFILQNADAVTKMNIQELASETFTSPSTIVRFCRKLGFEGFKEFKKNLIIDLTLQNKTSTQNQKEITPEDSPETVIDKITYKHMASIEETRTLIDPIVYDKCISLIDKAKTIYVFGIGSSFLVAKDLQQKLMRVNKSCVCFEDLHMQNLQARNIQPEDLSIIISYSGETKEMIRYAQIISRTSTPSISMTRFGSNTISNLCDYNLYVSANEPLHRIGAMTSRIAQLCLIDLLYIGYIHRHFEEAFKKITMTQLIKQQSEKE